MSLTEFLVCSPVVALLAFGAYDLNKRVEDQQATAILSRNATILSKKPDAAPTVHRILDGEERQEIEGGSLSVTVLDQQKLDEPKLDRLGKSMSNGTSFDSVSSLTGSAGASAARIVEGVQDGGEALGIFIKDGMRVVEVVSDVPGTTNGMQRTVGTLTSLTTGNPQAGAEAAALARRSAQRNYMRWESGYHPNAYTDFPFAGIALGLSKVAWDSKDKFSDGSDAIQTRCMTRLLTSDGCGTGFFRPFYERLRILANAKMLFSGTMVSTGWGAAVDKAATAAAKAAAEEFMSKAIETAVGEALTKLTEKATEGMRSKLDAELKKLAHIPGEQATNLAKNLGRDQLGGKIGGAP